MSEEELKEKLEKDFGLTCEHIYWEDTDDGSMIMLDNDEGEFPDNLWEYCFNTDFREDMNGNTIKLKEDDE